MRPEFRIRSFLVKGGVEIWRVQQRRWWIFWRLRGYASSLEVAMAWCTDIAHYRYPFFRDKGSNIHFVPPEKP